MNALQKIIDNTGINFLRLSCNALDISDDIKQVARFIVD